MSKNIVICSDGTGNTTIKNRGTNVFKLYEAVDTNIFFPPDSGLKMQVAFYDDGIGTEKLRLLRMLSGAVGWGLARNIRRLYGELARVYAPGDEIYLFGFSRGAFTVRMLARIIDCLGILKVGSMSQSDLERKIRSTYRHFLRGGQELQDSEYHNGIIVKFIGVWDTVDAVGLPRVGNLLNKLWHFKANDCNILGSVEYACHALSIDDARASFGPLLWDEKNAEKKIEQVWFAGAHSNVGGGYPRQGMSLVALDWMMEKASRNDGLRFIKTLRDNYYDLQNVNDRLYDPRKWLGALYFWKPRDIGQICEMQGTEPLIHLSVFERLALRPEGYAPSNLPQNLQVVCTYESQDPSAKKCEETWGKRYDDESRKTDDIEFAAISKATQSALRIRKVFFGLFILSLLIALALKVVGSLSVRRILGVYLSIVWLSRFVWLTRLTSHLEDCINRFWGKREIRPKLQKVLFRIDRPPSPEGRPTDG